MGRSERADQFERLCDLRAGYGSDPDDQRGVFSIEDVMRDAQTVMAAADQAVAEAVVTSTTDAHPTSPAGRIGLVEFDWTDSQRRIRRVDLPALRPRIDGNSRGDVDGWRHLGVFIDRFGPLEGDRPD
jgi:hypothetical protein